MTLFLFTASYPYGYTETFLEEEVLILSSQFERVEVVPLYGVGNPTRMVPENFVVHKPLIEKKVSIKNIKVLLLCSFSRLFWDDFLKKKVYISFKRLKTWAIAYLNTCIIAESDVIRDIEHRMEEHDICYYYWGKGANLMSIRWKGKARHISRFHGEWDLWEESSGNYAPLREKLAKSLDLAVFVSNKGEQYFKNKYPYCKTLTSRLGAKDVGIVRKSNDGVLRVVSCSAVYPLKRVPLIYSTLTKMTQYKIEWTHIGGGEDFEKLREIVNSNRYDHLKVTLLGHVSHDDVTMYYQNNIVDLFINVSTNEGVPVSIMEAISFDIPIVATNVGGTSEVVTSEVGELISANPSEEEIKKAIDTIYAGDYTPKIYWSKEYNSKKNFTEFCEIIKNL